MLTRPLTGLLSGVVVATALTAVTGAPARAEDAAAAWAYPDGVRMVQANIYNNLSVERFQADVDEVLAEEPDFVTYNEVPQRVDWVLAPKGYDLYRSTRNRYTKATPVAWRTDRWTKVDEGTKRISDYRKKPPGRRVRIGLRFANWVTLTSDNGRQVSVVSAHVPPVDNDMPDLLRPTVRSIRDLVAKLAPRGPVLVGGDFNVQYTSRRYPRDLFDEGHMRPTYDTLDSYFPTGDHHGNTIDYVFNRGKGQLRAEEHRPVELHSDHDAVVADLGWRVDAPGDTTRTVSDPTGDDAERRAAVNAFNDAVDATRSGAVVEVISGSLSLRSLYRRLVSATDRGVQVRLYSRGQDLTRLERRLRRHLAGDDDPRSEVVRCTDGCRATWRESRMPRTLMMLGDATGWTTRVDSGRNLNRRMITEHTRVTTRIGELAVQEGADWLAALP